MYKFKLEIDDEYAPESLTINTYLKDYRLKIGFYTLDCDYGITPCYDHYTLSDKNGKELLSDQNKEIPSDMRDLMNMYLDEKLAPEWYLDGTYKQRKKKFYFLLNKVIDDLFKQIKNNN